MSKPGGPITSTPIDFDDEAIEIIEYYQSRIDEDEYYVEKIERVTDQPKTELYISVKNEQAKEIDQSLALQNQVAKAVINNINRRGKKLSTSASQLTQREVSILVDECIENILVSEGYSYLLLSLIFGRDLKELHTDNFELSKTLDDCYLTINVDLPEHVVKPKFSKWVILSSRKMYLSIPIAVLEGINHFFILESKQAIIGYMNVTKNDLTSINQKYKTNITLNRIKNYFEYYLMRNAIDGSEIAFLLGKGLPQEPGTYYYSVDTEKLKDIYQDYVKNLFQDSESECESNNNKIGSQLQVNPSTVSSLFSEISNRLIQERNRGSEGIVDFHNLFVLHSILLLNLATGHRPVCDPYELLDIFDFNAKTIFISDKEERTELAARVLVLPDLAIEQLSHHLAHLNILSIYYRNTNPNIAEQVFLSKTGGIPR